jgi:hypothetical protein
MVATSVSNRGRKRVEIGKGRRKGEKEMGKEMGKEL